ncbi:MAG TPA: 50S ribosomal protein L21 [bacterium]|nr:50S ribosomal protein L21 [bacterium]
MYAIIETGGKQYRVSVGDLIDVEKLANEPGDSIEFGRVLLVNKGEQPEMGTPCIEGAKVIGRLISQGKARKVIIYRYKRRKNYRRKKGHRQPFSRVRIEQIVA